MVKAHEIAEKHIQKMNPDMWNGTSKKPDSFNTKIVTYPVTDDMEMDISFELDDGEWTHYVELRDKSTGDLLNCQHGYGVDSVQNLSDTINDVWKDGGLTI